MSQFLFAKIDWPLTLVASAICILGIVSLSGFAMERSEAWVLPLKQALFFGSGFILMVFLSRLDWNTARIRSFPVLFLYLVSVIFLAAVLVFGVRIRGAASWFTLGPFAIEPIELVKITLVLLLAKYFAFRHRFLQYLKPILISGMFVFLPVLIALVQPDLGQAIILSLVWLGILLLSGIPRKRLLLLLAAGVLVLIFSWQAILADYQRERIMAFVNPKKDPQGISWQARQAIIAVGSGGIQGMGFGQPKQATLSFLPEATTDFIFATFAEQFGFLGSIFLFSLFLFLILRMIWIAATAGNNFARIFASGLALLIFVQFIMNVGMNLGLFPITGVTMPLVSYGGSSLITLFFGLGILQGVAASSSRTPIQIAETY